MSPVTGFPNISQMMYISRFHYFYLEKSHCTMLEGWPGGLHRMTGLSEGRLGGCHRTSGLSRGTASGPHHMPVLSRSPAGGRQTGSQGREESAAAPPTEDQGKEEAPAAPLTGDQEQAELSASPLSIDKVQASSSLPTLGKVPTSASLLTSEEARFVSLKTIRPFESAQSMIQAALNLSIYRLCRAPRWEPRWQSPLPLWVSQHQQDNSCSPIS